VSGSISWSIPAPRFWNYHRFAAHGLYGGDVQFGERDHGGRADLGTRMHLIAKRRTIKGGTYYPIDGEKTIGARRTSRGQNNLGLASSCGSGGAFLPLQDEIFPDERPLWPHLLQPGADVLDRHPADRDP